MRSLLDTILLPTEISDFERSYLARMNRLGLIFFALHVPVLVAIAYFNQTGAKLALLLSLGVVAGPAIAYATLDNRRAVSVVYGFTSMLMGGVLVHVGQGPVQIEMHFYFFALLAMLAVFGNPLVIVVAAVTVALHHLLLWALLPASVFNYDAPIWVVLVHAAFVVLESIATCFIARSFFDNVIGLERIVTERTRELDNRNKEMRLVLDNVGQGFLTVDLAGTLSAERSAVVSRWFGEASEKQGFADYLGTKNADVADAFRLGFTEVVEQVMPLELTLDQLPKTFAVGDTHFQLEYIPIKSADGALERVLIVITDVSSEVERERLQAERQEIVQVFERVVRDRAGFLEFFEESDEQIEAIVSDKIEDAVTLTRVIHTLKGNAALFGIKGVAELCHAMESSLTEDGARPDEAARAALVSAWARVKRSLDTLRGKRHQDLIELDEADYLALFRALQDGSDRAELAAMLASWKLEPTAKRMERISEQANGIARRLEKGPIAIEVEDHGLRLDARAWQPFWSSFVHVVRNAIDHGLDPSDARAKAGKRAEGLLRMATRVQGDQFLVEIADDGRGIDWERVAVAAAKRGLPCSTRAELTEAVFADGVTTSSRVSEFSGRGVGMGAVRAASAALGGTVAIDSEPGAGTRVTFRFPIHRMSGAAPIHPRHAA